MAGKFLILAATAAVAALGGLAAPVAAQGYDEWDRWQARRRFDPPAYDPQAYEPEEYRARPRRGFDVEPDPNPGVATEPEDTGRYEPEYADPPPRTVLRRPPLAPRVEEPDDEPAGETRRAPRVRPQDTDEPRYQDEPIENTSGKPEGADGGARPVIAAIAPPRVAFSPGYAIGSIIIDTNGRKLYYVTGPTSAYAYPIGVGREGFSWTGSEKVSRVADWPDWYPPAEMRERKPELPERMLGGLRNPLGAKAIYLGNTLYRIHGTNDPKSIGKAESSGCFRMLNQHVLHLASLVTVGTQVSVVRSLNAPKPAPKPVIAAKPSAKPTKVAVKSAKVVRPAPVVRRRYLDRYWDEDDRPRYRRRYYDDRYYDGYYR